MTRPFRSRLSEEPGLLSRVTGRVTRASAARELETLLAEADSVTDVTLERVREVGERHGIDLGTRLRTLRRNLYRRFLEHCLVDYSLSAAEAEDIEHLRTLLHLEDTDVAQIQDQVARQVYGAAVQEVLDDHRLDEDEVRFLRSLRENLDLSEYHADRIVEQEQRRSQQRLLSKTAGQSSFLAPDGYAFQVEGVSTDGVQDAFQAAVEQTYQALPTVTWAKMSELKVQLEEGRVVKWAVTLEAGTQAPG